MTGSAAVGETPPRRFRCPDPLWGDAQEKAGRRGTNVSAILRGALLDFVEADEEAPLPRRG